MWATKKTIKNRHLNQIICLTKIFDNDLVTICKNKVTLTLNKPAYVGMCILGLSKVLMYGLHFGFTKNKYGNK